MSSILCNFNETLSRHDKFAIPPIYGATTVILDLAISLIGQCDRVKVIQPTSPASCLPCRRCCASRGMVIHGLRARAVKVYCTMVTFAFSSVRDYVTYPGRQVYLTSSELRGPI